MKDQLAQVDDKHLDRLQAIIRGMTPAERDDPKMINGSRRLRIANGSGVTVREVNDLVNRFFEARKMMAQMAGRFGFGGGGGGSQVAQGQEGQEGPRPDAAQGPRRLPRRHADAAPGRQDAGRAARPVAAGRHERRPGLRPDEVQAAEEPQGQLSRALHAAGVVLPGGESRDLWITDGRISFEPVPDAETLGRDVFLVPGLVDAHCHPGIGIGGPVDPGGGDRAGASPTAPRVRC